MSDQNHQNNVIKAMIEAHTNTTLNSGKKNYKQTKKLWGLKQN